MKSHKNRPHASKDGRLAKGSSKSSSERFGRADTKAHELDDELTFTTHQGLKGYYITRIEKRERQKTLAEVREIIERRIGALKYLGNARDKLKAWELEKLLKELEDK